MSGGGVWRLAGTAEAVQEDGVRQVLGFSLTRRQGMCACSWTPTYRQF